MKIALLNPPASTRIIRDYYCSKTSKSTYLFAPADLLLQSGILAEDNEIIVIDAVAEPLGPAKCLERLKKLNPDLTLGLIGAVSLNQDLKFYRSLKASLPSCKIFLSGEPVLEKVEDWLKSHSYIDGVLLRFVSKGIAQYIRGEKEPEGLVFRNGKGEIKSFPPSREPEYSAGRARQELFLYPNYFFSFAMHRRFATFLTDFGCPFQCKFCVMAGLGYRRRKMDEVEEELDHLSWLKIRELFLADQSFGAAPEHSRKVMSLFQKYGNSFTAFVRPDQRDPGFWKALKESGCHTVIVGLESAVPEVLSAYSKGYNREEIAEGITKAKDEGLRVVTTVILGLPEDSAQSIKETMKFVRQTEPDFVSYNLAVARSLTDLRRVVMQENLASGAEMDQGGSFAGIRTRSLDERELLRLKREAVRDFYLRPGYLIKRVFKVRSGLEFYALAREGLSVLSKNI